MDAQPRRRKCLCCKEFFDPDYRNRSRQTFCAKPDCRRASRAASQRRWLAQAPNRDYFRGQENVQRVQRWRREHPGYWKKRPAPPDSSQGAGNQPVAPNRSLVTQRQVSGPLQDVCLARHPVFIGLVSMVTGGALQEDIAATVQRLETHGRDILGLAAPAKSSTNYDYETSNSA